MNNKETLENKAGVKFDDRTRGSGSLNPNNILAVNNMTRKSSFIKNFIQTHAKTLKLTVILGTVCLMTSDVYAYDVVKSFKDNIVTPIWTICKDNYNIGVGILAMGYITMTEGADMRTKSIRAGVGAILAYALGNMWLT